MTTTIRVINEGPGEIDIHLCDLNSPEKGTHVRTIRLSKDSITPHAFGIGVWDTRSILIQEVGHDDKGST